MSIRDMLMNPDFQVGLLASGAPRSTPTNLAGGFAEAVDYMNKAQAARQQQAIQIQQQARLQQQADMEQQQYQTGLADTAALRSGIGGLDQTLGKSDPAEYNRQVAFQILQHGDPGEAARLLTGGYGGIHAFAPSQIEKEVRVAGFDPATPEGQEYARKLIEAKTIEGQQRLAEAKGAVNQQTGFAKEGAIADMKKIDDQRGILQSAPTFGVQLDDLERLVNSIPGWQLGATVGEATSRFAPQVQQFQSAANQATLTLKQILGFPNNNFSDSDLRYLSKMIGDPNTTKEAILANIARIRRQNQIGIDRAKRMDDYYHANGYSLKGFEQMEPGYKAPPMGQSTPVGSSSQPSVGLLGGDQNIGVGLLGQGQGAMANPANDTHIDYRSMR